MHTVRLARNGCSLVMTLPKKVLEHLRWFQGDRLVLELSEKSIVVTNFREHDVVPVRRPLPFGDAVTRYR